ncbi:MAG: ROK family protein [Gomphosphaeria aponina SAG 52.96 = DSM 107014]|uniref:ROK family protein n=1 Tax=Gomphosphaeria aponina SAG 52.96 = DSM 107014 TaxID=1521640 RepID=A0A941GTC2_9CHRO|nr:ROK family protein [Gomphosphaeria aponina SAG 52.96 = DSM 107014]
MMDNLEVIGIDIGGTAIKLGRFLRDGTCLQSVNIPTPQPSTPLAVVEAIAASITQLNCNNNCLALGVGTPGPVDETSRIAKVAINLAQWQDVPLADWLEIKTGLKTIIANDANCALVGEAWLGAGKRFQNLILLTLGTGVGGAIILDGKLFTGQIGAAGELGLITINYDGPICNSGNQGSLEQYVSLQAIRRLTGLEPVVLAQKARAGDKFALDFWQEYGRILGAGLASLIYILTPEAIIIGGGISAGADLFFPATLAEIERRVLFTSRFGLKLLQAELGNNAGMLGAAKLAWSEWGVGSGE